MNRKELVLLSNRLEQYEPQAAFAYYYRGLILSRGGRVERALMSFKEALVSELQREDPDGHNLRLFRDKIRETEADLIAPRAPLQSPSPPPP